MLKRQALGILLGLIPSTWKKNLSIHLGAPHVQWSLRQLRHFGFVPQHVLDVGAYQGDWARTCLNIFPEAIITCIEPQHGQQTNLKELASRSCNIRVIQTLLGRKSAPQVPFLEIGSGSSVLLRTAEPTSVHPMTTIDALIHSGQCEPPDFLKLDVQGYELEVLEGWAEKFERCKVIQCEISLLPLVSGGPLINELVVYLEGRGFVMFDITELIRSPSDGAVWQIDSLFCRKDSPLRTERIWR
jgi:FkbM family methyltransferase